MKKHILFIRKINALKELTIEKDVDCLKELKQKELLEEREKLLEEQKESDKRHYLRTFLE